MDWPRYLTLTETAAFTELPLDFVYQLSAQDKLPGLIRWGTRTLRVDREALQLWLNEQASNQEAG